jgi:hypothetical protein
MSDSKYGRLFTEQDLIDFAYHVGEELAGVDRGFSKDQLDSMVDDFTGKFPPGEPLFLLRARDKRALGAVRHYRDHQSQKAPSNHLDGVEKAYRQFSLFAEEHPDLMREPD